MISKTKDTDMEHEIFEEVEHWLYFIKVWDQENEEKVPDDVITALELALKKAIFNYKDRNLNLVSKIYFH